MNNINILWTTYAQEGLVEGTEERVRAIKDWEGYFITDHGRVLSGKHRSGYGGVVVDFERLKELSVSFTSYKKESTLIPYKTVTLSETRQRRKCAKVHSLVANHFIPNPNNLPVVDHLDHYHNNHYKQLEWVTSAENSHRGKRTKEHTLTTPHGNTITVRNLAKFCRENSLSSIHLHNRGKSKGYRLIK